MFRFLNAFMLQICKVSTAVHRARTGSPPCGQKPPRCLLQYRYRAAQGSKHSRAPCTHRQSALWTKKPPRVFPGRCSKSHILDVDMISGLADTISIVPWRRLPFREGMNLSMQICTEPRGNAGTEKSGHTDPPGAERTENESLGLGRPAFPSVQTVSFCV